MVRANHPTDSFGRRFNYLRLSVTEACNFRCVYCLPNGAKPSAEKPLSAFEIKNLVGALSEMGVSKVRVTGGEPTLRKDLLEVIEAISTTSGIQTTALTTNGSQLRGMLPRLKAAGLTALNVSVDSLSPSVFARITGRDEFQETLRAVEDALGLGIEKVKVNVVLLKGLNDREISVFEEWTRHVPISVRFIELMQTRDNAELFAERHVEAGFLQRQLIENGWTPKSREATEGPALNFARTGYCGSLGIVAPYSHGFCESCNRLRVSSRGDLRLCLFGEADYSLRPLLARPGQRGELKDEIQRLFIEKGRGHRLLEGHFGSTQTLASIGG